MSRELEHLEEANRHLTDADRRIAEQQDRIAKLERDGHDTTHPLALLRVFEQTRDLMVDHRDMILRERGDNSSGDTRLGRAPMRTKQAILKSYADECSRRAALTTDPLIRHQFLKLAAHWLELIAIRQELEAWREPASPGILRKRAALAILPAQGIRNGNAGWGTGLPLGHSTDWR